MRFTTTVKAWQAVGAVEGAFDPLAATWEERFTARAAAEPLPDSAVQTLFSDMRVEGARFWLDAAHAELGFRWLLQEQASGDFYLVEPASPRVYGGGIRHIEANARRLTEGPVGV